METLIETGVQIRKAHLDDKHGIADIIKVLHLNIPSFVWNNLEFIEKQIAGGEYFVAERAGAIAGIISLRVRKKVMHIETLAVAPEHRLQKIGTQLVGFAKQATKERGLADLCACSFLEYKIGDFYTRQGFSLLPKPGQYQGRPYHIFVTKV